MCERATDDDEDDGDDDDDNDDDEEEDDDDDDADDDEDDDNDQRAIGTVPDLDFGPRDGEKARHIGVEQSHGRRLEIAYWPTWPTSTCVSRAYRVLPGLGAGTICARLAPTASRRRQTSAPRVALKSQPQPCRLTT